MVIQWKVSLNTPILNQLNQNSEIWIRKILFESKEKNVVCNLETLTAKNEKVGVVDVQVSQQKK